MPFSYVFEASYTHFHSDHLFFGPLCIFLIFLIFSLTICAFPANKTHEGGMGDSGGPLFLPDASGDGEGENLRQ